MASVNNYEISNVVEEQVQNFFSKLDKDDNGVLTYKECINYWRSQGVQDPEYITNVIFFQYDKNRTKTISESEFRHEVARLRKAIAYYQIRQLNLATFLSKFDKNYDAKITLDELENEFNRVGYQDPKGVARCVFYTLDKNKDGSVTMDEISNHFKRIDEISMGTSEPQQ
ncbi:hypothetical protein CYY_005374 [Polysphondylium violaceum]|uniref:EF-hand domain-containing protein n=1 Tax=Polysphondylium violaceum TaxID=133409 RepID=A0A8J4US86_9MYCE|nr:hypothetical protein CYY_005374 [Polysphondylium violaceum]